MLGLDKVTRRLALTAIGGVLLLAFAGCAREDQNALIIIGPDSVVVVAPLLVAEGGTEPGGSADATSLELLSFDPSAVDAYARSTELFERSEWPFFRGGEDAGFGYWRVGHFDGDGIGAASAAEDPRLPALTQATPLTYDFMYFAVPGTFNDPPGYDFFGCFEGMTPSTDFLIGFERNAVTVNGELDQVQVLEGQAVDQPDELYWLDGSPGGDFNRRADLFNTSNPYPAEPNANPFVWGIITTGSTGFTCVDAVISCEDANGFQVWNCDETEDPSLAPFAINKQQPFNLPQYNYMTVWEMNPDGSPDYSSPVWRYQLTHDLNALGAPVNNTYAPFPRSAATAQEKALGTGAVSRPDSVVFTLDNLKELDGTATYQVWAELDDGTMTGLDFLYTPPGGTQTAATSFNGGEGEHEVIVEYPDAALNIVLTIEASAGATMPSNARFLWTPGLQEVGQQKTSSLPVRFGAFDEGRTWAISGAGRGGLFGEQLRYRYTQLPRPPVGYKYVGWLSSGDTMFARLPDATFTTPPEDGYQVLTDADTDTEFSPFVVPSLILESLTTICVEAGEQGCFDLGSYDSFFFSLEPKSGIMTDPGPTRVQEGVLPAQ